MTEKMILLLAVCAMCAPPPSFGQADGQTYTFPFTAASGPETVSGPNASVYWSFQVRHDTSVSACTITVDTSPNGSDWTALSPIAGTNPYTCPASITFRNAVMWRVN